jgi:anti-anti-sigma factor
VVINHAEILEGMGAIVAGAGALDSSTSPEAEAYVNRLLDRNIHIILFDAEKMPYASSEGIGLFLFLAKRISDAGGYFLIFNLSEELRTLFGVLDFEAYLDTADTRADALRIANLWAGLQKGGRARETAASSTGMSGVFDRTSVAEERSSGGGTIVECPTCRTSVRVFEDGAYLCPHCRSEFRIMDRSVSPKGGENSHADFGTLVIECAKCNSLVRIKNSGSFRCPDCDAHFTVAPNHSVVF